MISGWETGSKSPGRARWATRLGFAAFSLVLLALPWGAAAQVSLTQPNAGATFTGTAVCPFVPCNADVPYSIGVAGAPISRLELVLTNRADSSSTVLPLCLTADFDAVRPCPAPTFSMSSTVDVAVGSWTLAVRAFRGTAVEMTDPVPFTVTASNAARPGPVTITAINPNATWPAIRTRDASAQFPDGLPIAASAIEILGENLADNPYLEVYLAPKPSFEPAISPASEPTVETWCKLRAEIVQRTAVAGMGSRLVVRLPEVPLFMHTTCGFEPQGLSSPFAKQWRWVIRDAWIRPERVHEWIAAPPQRSHPGHDAPPFLLIKPPYPFIDGFGFDNQRTDATYKEFLSVFGNNAYICLGIGVCATRVPDPLYHLIWWPIYLASIDSTGGSCAGMSATSLLMAREELQPEEFEPGVHFPIGLLKPAEATYDSSWCAPVCGPYTPTNLWSTIRMNHGVQISRQFLEEMVESVGEAILDPDITSIRGVPDATLARIRTNPLGYVLCFFQPGKGHCVTPYRVEGNRIWIYDNNEPEAWSDRYIDIVDGDYDYPARVSEPRHGNAIVAFPIEIWKEGRTLLGVDDFTLTGGIRLVQLFVSGSADMRVTNDEGGRWGWEDDGTFTDRLGGALALPPVGQSGDTVAPMPLLLAMNQPVPTIDVKAKGGRYLVQTVEGRMTLQVEATDAQDGDTDRVRLAYRTGRLAAAAFTPARRATRVIARTGLALGQGERAVFHLVGLDVSGGRTMRIGGDVATRTVTYTNDTGGATHHLVQLDYVAGPAGSHGRMLYGPFEVPQGATQQVVLNGWPDVSRVRAELDFDGNGTIDSTRIVTGRPVVAPTDLQASADLSVVKTASASAVLPGDRITYTATVRNDGPAAASAVRLDDALPPQVTAVQPITTHGTCSVAAMGLTCQLGSLAPGESATVEYAVVPARPGFLANSAHVAGAEGDPDWTNNTSMTVAEVLARIDIMPRVESNPMVPGLPGLTRVAVLGSAAFDVIGIDPGTLRFGPAGARARRTDVKDVDRDGFPDLIQFFERQDTGLGAGDTTACVRGRTVLGAEFRGCDGILALPPRR